MIRLYAPFWGFRRRFSIRELKPRTEDALLSGSAGIMLAASFYSLLQPGLEYGIQRYGSSGIAVILVISGMLLGGGVIWTIHSYAPHEHFHAGREGPDASKLARLLREAGVLLPQLAVAAAVRKLAIRKGVWLLGAVLSALSLFGMAAAAVILEGATAGGGILLMLVFFSLAKGLCSVSAKDVLGKTASKSRRGALMGWSASLSGIAVLAIGLWVGASDLQAAGLRVFAGLLIAGGILSILAAFLFATRF